MALHLPGFLHSTDLSARPEYCSAQNTPMGPISLQVKDKPLTMAHESLHMRPPALLQPLSPTLVLIPPQPYWLPTCSSHLPATLLPQGLCTSCSLCQGHSSPGIAPLTSHLLQDFAHLLLLREPSLTTYLEVQALLWHP